MIIAKIKDFEKYIKTDGNFAVVAENIAKYSDKNLEKGRYDINENVFAVVNSYQSAEAKENFFENHHKYIDIQCVISGSEEIHTAPTEKLVTEKEYDQEADYELFKTPDEYSTLVLAEGEFAIFYPGEAHLPGVMKKSGAQTIHKVIFKVKI